MIFFIKPLLHWSGGILFYLCPSVQDIFRRIFLSNYWWQKSDISSQSSYWYAILWEVFLDPSDSYFLFADLVFIHVEHICWGIISSQFILFDLVTFENIFLSFCGKSCTEQHYIILWVHNAFIFFFSLLHNCYIYGHTKLICNSFDFPVLLY